jgi:hypothetical protein
MDTEEKSDARCNWCACCDEWAPRHDAAVLARSVAEDRAEKMHLLGLKLARELADLERENASLRRRLREGGR